MQAVKLHCLPGPFEAHVQGIFGQRELDVAAAFGDRHVAGRHAVGIQRRGFDD